MMIGVVGPDFYLGGWCYTARTLGAMDFGSSWHHRNRACVFSRQEDRDAWLGMSRERWPSETFTPSHGPEGWIVHHKSNGQN